MANEFNIKNGFVSQGNSTVNASLSANTVFITATPTSGITSTQILMRNSTTGVIEYTDNTSPTIYNYGLANAMINLNFLT